MTETPDLAAWIGREEEAHDVVTAESVARMAATLDWHESPGLGDELPACWHWMYFVDVVPTGELAEEGHVARGDFLPPVPLPRRMWAGGRLSFRQPIRVGEAIFRRSEIADIKRKRGRSGDLAFVTVRHEISGPDGVAVEEEHDIVYREAPSGDAPRQTPPSAPDDARWRRTVSPGPVLLFRYSALTFNAHRIHFDLDYATRVDGYPGLVVHGPLIATLLLDLVRREAPDRRLAGFDYRGVSPLFAGADFTVNGRPDGDGVELWAAGPGDALAMTGRATLHG